MCHFMSDTTQEGKPRSLPSLPYPTAAKVAAEASGLGAYLCISGGEPLLYDRLPELIGAAKSNGGICTLVTNGVLLERRAAELVQAGPDLVVVSVLGPEGVHDEITRVKGSFNRAAAGIEAVRSQLGHGGGTAVVVNTAISSANVGHLHELMEAVRDWPIDAVNIQHLWFTTPEMLHAHERNFGSVFQPCFTEASDDGAEHVKAEMLAEELASLRGSKLPFPLHIFPDLPPAEVRRYYGEPSAFVGRQRAVCAWLFCEVSPTGDVLPCYGYKAGNVTDRSLADIWNGRRFRAFRRKLFEARAFPICARCCGLFRRD